MSNAHDLQPIWSVNTSKSVNSEPIVVNGIVYVGSSDGNESAYYATNGTHLWSTFLGVDNATPACGGPPPGITSTATYFDGRVYVNGGYSMFYALNAATGKIVWKIPIGGTNAMGYYLWSSPLLYNDSAYIGIASQCDKPMVPAGLERVSLSSHAEIAYFNSSTPDPNGSSIWGSPAVNAKTNTVYVATGNPYTTHTSTYSESIVALNATTLKVLAAWQVPADQTVGDGDFGVTPTLFKLADGVGVVTAMNKNGCLYEWYQSNLTLRWEDSLTTQVGDRYSTSESNRKVFAVSRGPTLGGITYNASVTAINATNGAYVWQFVTNTTPTLGYGTPLIVDHVVLVPIGNTLYALQESSGRVLYAGSPGGVMVAPASFSRGEIFGGAGNDLVAYSVALGVTASQSAKSGVAPLSDSFTSAGTAGVPPYAYSWNFGGGGVSTAQDPTHVFSRPGTPTVKLTVTDLTGATLTREFTVRVHRS